MADKEDTKMREASHSGSWYSADCKRQLTAAKELQSQMDRWMSESENDSDGASGADFSALKGISSLTKESLSRMQATSTVEVWQPRHSSSSRRRWSRSLAKCRFILTCSSRIVILGPSHFASLENSCGLTAYRQLATPTGTLTVDRDGKRRLLIRQPLRS
jgi:predicted class III extradiol MEMO1 family dioxygenase